MAQQTLALPAQPVALRTPRTGEHDPLEVALKKLDDNCTELYTAQALSTARALAKDVYTLHFADANTAEVAHAAILRAGTITRISVVPWENNGDAACVFTASIAAVAVTHPALSIALDAVAGAVSSVVPTAANAVVAGSNLRITSNGGGDTTMPVTVTVEVTPS